MDDIDAQIGKEGTLIKLSFSFLAFDVNYYSVLRGYKIPSLSFLRP